MNTIPPPLNLSTRFVMLIGGVMVMIAMAALSPVLPQIETALARTPEEKLLVKMLVSILGVTMVIGAPATGFLVDRIGLRKILIIHSLIYAVAGTAGLYLSDIHLLLGSRLLVGLSAAGMATISMTLINTRLQGNDRARWMGYHISSAMAGSLIVFPIIGVLGEIGWRLPSLLYASSLVVVIAVFSGLQEPQRKRDAVRVATRDENPLRWFPLWFLPLALVLGGVTYLPNVYLGFVAREVGVTSPTIISTVMLADSIIGASMALLFGRSQRFLSSNAAFMFSFGCVGLGMLIVSMASSLTGVVAGMLVFGFGIGWFVPNLMVSLSQRVSQERQGRAVGIVKAAHYIASPLGVLAVEPIARIYGPSGAMFTSAVVALGMVALFGCLLLRRGNSIAAAPVVAD